MALGRTHGSCLPVALSVTLFPLRSHVDCSLEIVETGFIATLKYTFSPVVIPPRVPPELLVSGFIFRLIRDNL